MVTQVKTYKGIKRSNMMLYAAIVILVVVFTALKPSFFTVTNLSAIMQSMACLCVLGVGATMILTLGEIDISNGAMMSVAPCMIAVLILQGMPTALGLALALAVILGLGLLNGVLVAKVRIPSFIATLGVQGIAMGLSRILTDNKPVLLEDNNLILVFGGYIGDFPVSVIWMFALLAVGWVIMYKTKFGRNLHAIGDNKEAAALFGIRVDAHIIGTFVVAAAFVFFAGMMESLRSSYMRAGFGENQMLYSIVVALIGGTSVSGGKSNVIGTFVGAAFVTIVSNGLFLMALSSYAQNIIIGIIIVAVLSANAVMENRDKELKRT